MYHILPDEKITDDYVIGRDLESLSIGFFSKNPQLRRVQLDFSELIDNIDDIIPYLNSVDELILEGFSPTYTINVTLTKLKSLRALTLINCVFDGKSLSSLNKLEKLIICNCKVSEKNRSINDFISRLPLIELHDLSDDPQLDNIDPKYINYSKMKKITIQSIMHDKTFTYPPIDSITIINNGDHNVAIQCSKYTEVILM